MNVLHRSYPIIKGLGNLNSHLSIYSDLSNTANENTSEAISAFQLVRIILTSKFYIQLIPFFYFCFSGFMQR